MHFKSFRKNVVCSHCQFLRERVLLRAHAYEYGGTYNYEPSSSCHCYEINAAVEAEALVAEPGHQKELLVTAGSLLVLVGAAFAAVWS